VCSEITLQQM